MAKRLETSIIINKEPHQIYFYIADLANLPFWSDIKSVELVSGNGGIGTIYNLVSPTVLGSRRRQVEITQKKAHELFAFRDSSQSIENETGFALEPAGVGQTKVVAYQESGIGSLVSVLSLNFLTSRDAVINLKKMLENLKVVLELESPNDTNTVVRHN